MPTAPKDAEKDATLAGKPAGMAVTRDAATAETGGDESLSESQLDKTPALPQFLQLTCPQCGTRRSVVGGGNWGETPCDACGSRLSLQEAVTVDVNTVRGSGVVSGQKVGRFELMDRLGAGGFGEVWK